MTDIQLGWVAGIIDGEGTIRMQKPPNCGMSVAVGNTDLRMLLTLRELCGGKLYRNGGHSKLHNAKPFFSWQLTGRFAFPLLEQVGPILVVKREQAELALQLRAVYGKKDNYHPERAMLWREERTRIHAAIAALNQRGLAA